MSSSNGRGHGPGPVPDRWLHCPRKSNSLIDGKFLAFKTPLSERFDEQVPIACRFPPSMVFKAMKNYKVKIGLWIDLTNTSRFYEKECVVKAYDDPTSEVTYVKVQCRGHGETPSEEQTKLFIDICRKFIRTRPLEAIGVHCTHGFNRTGFLIVSYLVEEMDWSVEAAILEFARLRPPGIYKEDYLMELCKRYDPDAFVQPPPRPSWCLEYEDENEENDSASPSRPDKRKSELMRNNKKLRRDGRPPEFMEGISGVSPVLDQSKVYGIQQIVKEMCKFPSNGFAGSQPVSMDLENIRLLQGKPYRVSWKADGTRYMMLILGEKEVYFLDRDNNVFQVRDLRFVHRKDLRMHLSNTLLDGEMVIDKHEGKSIPRYLVYDIIMVDGIDVTEFRFFPQRLQCIDADIINPRIKAMSVGIIDKNKEPFSVRAKSFYPVEKTSSFFSEKFCQQLSHEPDGLIFQPSYDPYKAGQCKEVLKWKPPTHNSIDFKLKIVKEEGEGILTRKVGYLYVGGLDKEFATMKYTSAIKELNNKVVECKFENNIWSFMRERTDKSFPNSYKTAVAVWNSIRHPVTKEYLLDRIKNCRYQSDGELMPPPPLCPPRRSYTSPS